MNMYLELEQGSLILSSLVPRLPEDMKKKRLKADTEALCFASLNRVVLAV